MTASANLIKCGRNVTTTPHYHLSTADVRACYNGQHTASYNRDGQLLSINVTHPSSTGNGQLNPNRPSHPSQRPSHTSATPTHTAAPTADVRPHKDISPRQAKYYTDLTRELNLPNRLNTFNGWTISPELDRLKELRMTGGNPSHPHATTPAQPLPADHRNGNDLRAPSFRAPFTPVEDGVYLYQGTYFKVVTAVESGRRYAKRFDTQTKKFSRAPGKIRELTADMVVSPEQAAKFGKLYGICCFCSRTLTDERSIGVGYGPVCAEHYGLPWGD